jgi:hypothetical protein
MLFLMLMFQQTTLIGLKRLRTEVTINSHFAILSTIMEPLHEPAIEELEEPPIENISKDFSETTKQANTDPEELTCEDLPEDPLRNISTKDLPELKIEEPTQQTNKELSEQSSNAISEKTNEVPMANISQSHVDQNTEELQSKRKQSFHTLV